MTSGALIWECIAGARTHTHHHADNVTAVSVWLGWASDLSPPSAFIGCCCWHLQQLPI